MKPPPICRVVSTSELQTGVVEPTLDRVAFCYLPCQETWWTSFLSDASKITPGLYTQLIGSRSRAFGYAARAFLEAGASMELEICVGRVGRCHGYACVCSDSFKHKRLYECPGPSLSRDEANHRHEWISARNILSDRLGIPRVELLQFEARSRSTRSVSHADFLNTARDTEAVWQRLVETRIRDKILALDHDGHYSWITKAEAEYRKSHLNGNNR